MSSHDFNNFFATKVIQYLDEKEKYIKNLNDENERLRKHNNFLISCNDSLNEKLWWLSGKSASYIIIQSFLTTSISYCIVFSIKYIISYYN